jgi:hypothetical protein
MTDQPAPTHCPVCGMGPGSIIATDPTPGCPGCEAGAFGADAHTLSMALRAHLSRAVGEDSCLSWASINARLTAAGYQRRRS